MTGKGVLLLYRTARRLHRYRLSRSAKVVKLLNVLLFGAEIDHRATLGRRLRLPHPVGVVVGRGVVVGDDVKLQKSVTLGGSVGRREDGRSYPTIGSRVWVLTGAVVVGPIRIADETIIGANSVVAKSIDEGGLYGGVPARRLRDLDSRELALLRGVAVSEAHMIDSS